MTQVIKEFNQPIIEEIIVDQHRRKVSILRCRIAENGQLHSLILTDPKQIHPLEILPDKIVSHINERKWAALRIRKETIAGHVSYGLDFLSDEPNGDYTLRSSDCTIEPIIKKADSAA